MKKNLLFCSIIFLLTLIVYSNTFHNSFHHDDDHVIVRNPFVKSLEYIPQFFFHPLMGSGIFQETSSYRPLLMATFAMNYYFGGLNVFGYHLINFLLHVGCALLVYFLILSSQRFPRPPPPEGNPLIYQMTALFGALLFALHPVQTESVTYITGRSSLLTGIFFLGSFYAYLRYVLTGKAGTLILSVLMYGGALLAKETAVTLMVLLLCFNFLFPQDRAWKGRVLSLVPHLLLTILFLGMRVYFFGTLQHAGDPIRPLYDHLVSQPRAWVHYLGTQFLPLNLNFDYDFAISHSILEGEVLGSLFLLAVAAGVILFLSRSNRWVVFWAQWWAVNLLPTNSIIALEDLVSDRWLYLSSVGYSALFAMAVGWVFQTCVVGRSRAVKMVFLFSCALVIELHGYSTTLRNFVWSSSRTLWEDTAAKSPNKARVYDGLGTVLAKEGRWEEAAQAHRKAIALWPENGQAYFNLGCVLMNMDKREAGAIEAYQKSLSLNYPLVSEIYNNLGLIYFKLGRAEEGEKALRAAVEIRPHHAAPYSNLGNYYEKRGDIDRAIYCYEQAVKLAPDFSQGYGALSVLYGRKGWKEKSQEAYENFVKRSPRKPSSPQPQPRQRNP
jgi:tetratricopeptide (TPR) repeat protein